MSLRFYFGPSGSGKSHRIYEEIMQRAAQEPGRNFLIIVPDQFTMQTQKDLVMRSDRGGILKLRQTQPSNPGGSRNEGNACTG